jgi:hypothetical protein
MTSNNTAEVSAPPSGQQRGERGDKKKEKII